MLIALFHPDCKHVLNFLQIKEQRTLQVSTFQSNLAYEGPPTKRVCAISTNVHIVIDV